MRRKIISLVLAAIMILSSFSVVAFAQGNCTIRVETVNAEPGQTVTVNITVENNPGIIGLGPFSVSYDSSALTLTDAQNGSAFSTLTLTKPSRYKSGCVFSWYAVDIADSDIKDGTILTLTFTVDSVATADSYAVEVTCPSGSTYDKNLNEINPVFVNGGVSLPGNSSTPTDPTNPTDGCTISVDSATAEAGETVTVNVNIANNPGIIGLGPFSVNYDSSVLTLTDAQNGDTFSKLTLTKPSRYKSGCVFSWYAVDIADSDIKDGTILSLTFTVNSNAKSGTYDIEIVCPEGSAYDKNLNEVTPAAVSGGITVSEEVIPTVDCNISVGTAEAAPGETVTVDVSVENNPGIIGLGPLSVSYDESAITLINAEQGEAFSALTLTQPSRYKSGCIFSWYAVDIQDSNIKDGAILRLTFTVSPDAESGTYAVELECPAGSVYDKELNEVTPDFVSGGITVTDVDYAIGDVTRNGTVDIDDIDMILSSCTGGITLSAKQTELADVDGDGVIDAFDAAAIDRATEYNDIIIGDLDLDGDVDLDDYALVKAHISGTLSLLASSYLDKRYDSIKQKYPEGTVITQPYYSADLNGDKAVDAFDMFLLDKIVVENTPPAVNFTYTVTSGNNAKITGYTGSDVNVVVPAVIDGYNITAIDNYAFKGNKNIVSVVFESGIKTIGYGAFLNCTALKEVVLADNATSIGTYAFKGCTSLEKIVIPATVASINANSFTGCTNLKIYGEQGTYAETYANNNSIPFICFSYEVVSGKNVRITGYNGDDVEIMIPAKLNGNTVTAIYNYAFRNNSNIQRVEIASGIKTIGYGAFLKCSSLTEAVIGDGTTSIGTYAFKDCTSLSRIVIPASVTSINANSFTNCPNLTIYGTAGSYAETYANNNSINFVAI